MVSPLPRRVGSLVISFAPALSFYYRLGEDAGSMPATPRPFALGYIEARLKRAFIRGALRYLSLRGPGGTDMNQSLAYPTGIPIAAKIESLQEREISR